MSKLARFSVSVDPVGFGDVVINGEDRSDEVQGFRVESVLGQPSVLTLYASAVGTLTGEGIVEVEREPSDSSVIQAFLAGIDPTQLERAAIDRSDFGEGNITALALDVLRDLAR